MFHLLGLRFHPVLLLTIFMVMTATHCPSSMALAVQESNEKESSEDERLSPELEALGNTLKAAVVSGNMNEEQAWELWNQAVEQSRDKPDEERMWQDRYRDDEYDDTNTRQRISRLIPPDPLEPSMLLEPEFNPRDVYRLNNWLKLDSDRTLIVEAIINDYSDSMQKLTSNMRPALQSYRKAEEARDIEAILAYLEDDVLKNEIDIESSANTMERNIREYARKSVTNQAQKERLSREQASRQIDEKTAAWTAELSSGLENMNEQLGMLRDRMRARVDAVKLPEGNITSRDLLALAENIKERRRELREDVTEMLFLMLVIDDDPEAHRKLDSALARLRIERGFRHGRMGGERINPWKLVRDIESNADHRKLAEELLSDALDNLADLVDTRSSKSIDREIEAFRLLVARDDLVESEGDEDNVPLEIWYEVIEPFTNSWHAQIDSSVDYRDSILQLVASTRQAIAVGDSATADLYYDNAIRSGFGSELRSRWSERAMVSAMDIEDLDNETKLVLTTLHDQTMEKLRGIRDKAIQKRLLRDPELARKPILSLWSLDESQGKPWSRDDWTGHEMEAHQKLNKDVEYSLRALLTPEQFNAIPARRGTATEKNSDERKMNGKVNRRDKEQKRQDKDKMS